MQVPQYPEPGTLDYRILWHFLFNHTPIKPGQLAKELDVPHQTLNSALIRLSEVNLLDWAKYKDVQITDQGSDRLQHLEYHFHLIEIFLMDSLGLTSEEAMREASKLAPYFSCNLIAAIFKKTNAPTRCPNHQDRKIKPDAHTADCD